MAADIGVQVECLGGEQDHRGADAGLAFGGGLPASVSPCILALLPVNLSRFGLVSSFAGAVLSDFRGYTLLIFLASLFTGLAKRSRLLLEHGDGIVRFGSLALVGTGLSYLWIGARWFSGG